MSDNPDVGAVVITIEEEDQGLAELEALLRTQSQLLIDGAGRPLLDNLSQQEKILRRLGKLEEQRLRLVEELTAAGRIGAPPARLDELARALPEPERSSIERLARAIAGRAAAVRGLERRNRRLIEAGRRCLDGFVQLILSPRDRLTYGNGGAGATEPRFISSQA